MSNATLVDLLSKLSAELGAETKTSKTTKAKTEKPSKKTPEQKAEELDARKWYDPVPETEQTIASDIPAELLAEIESVKNDKALGSNRRELLLSALEAQRKQHAESGLVIVLETMREEKRTERTRHTTRVAIAQGTNKITLRPHELALILKHAAPIRQWLHDTAMSGMMD